MSFPDPSFGSTAEELSAFYAPQIKDKVILTTGISPGSLGAHFVQTIAAYKPKLLILAARSPSNIQETAAAIAKAHPDVPTRHLVLDLGDLKQVWSAAREILEYEEEIDVLVNSAAVMACPYTKTVDGLELQFGTNHIGHFLFTNAILSKILKVKGRVINVSSAGHRFGGVRFDDVGFNEGKDYQKWVAYGQSKTANMLFSVSLATRFSSQGLTSFSIHPGSISTHLGRHLDAEGGAEIPALDKRLENFEAIEGDEKMKTVSQGTSTYVFAAFDQGIAEENGAYLLNARLATPKEIRHKATDKDLAEKLWRLSNEIVGQEF
ncbi:short-chain dehydrogenase [Venturia nashicola]|nr:short-chain dehydrogenase [Venturia nashicola]